MQVDVNDPAPHFSRKPVATNVERLGNNVIQGKWGLVSFQRDSVWSENSILKFFHSLFLGVPVGVIYAWTARGEDTKSKRTNQKLDPHPSRAFSGFEKEYSNGEKSEYLILDGQQRLTSLAKLRASINDKEKMKRIVVNLDKLRELDSTMAFRFAKKQEPEMENEIVLQDLLKIGTLRYLEQSNVNETYRKHLDQLEHTFTKRRIAVQILEPWLDNEDALWVFLTVNKEGAQLDDLDLAESILRAKWDKFPDECARLVNSLQSLSVGVDRDNKPEFKLNYDIFTKQLILRCVLFDIFGSADYITLLSSRTLDVYGSTTKNGTKFSEKSLIDSFNKIKKGAERLKTYFKEKLRLPNTKGLAKYAVINGIIFFAQTNKDGNTDSEIGKALSWVILSSHYTHWNAISPFDALEETLNIISAETVDWDALASTVIDEKRAPSKPERVALVKERTGETKKITLKQLIPPHCDDMSLVYGFPVSHAQGFPLSNFALYTIPFYMGFKDWRDGTRIGTTEINKRTIHHIFPKSKFSEDPVVSYLNNNEDFDGRVLTFDDILNVDKSKSKDIKIILLESINHGISIVSSNIEKFDKKKNQNEGKLGKQDRIKYHHLTEKYESLTLSLSELTGTDDPKQFGSIMSKCTAWWYRHGNNFKHLKDRLGNYSILKQAANSSLGSEWPIESIFNRYGVVHEQRVVSQFIPLDNKSIFDKAHYTEFCDLREEKFHSSVIDLLESFIDGNFELHEPKQEDIDWVSAIQNDDSELEFERKSSVFHDIDRDVTPNHSSSYIVSALVKACVAMANAGGGYVVVGVDDDGNFLGLDHDFEYLSKRDPNLKNLNEKFTSMVRDKLDQTEPTLRYNFKFISNDEKQCLLITINGALIYTKQSKYYTLHKQGNTNLRKDVYWFRRPGQSKEFVLNSNKEMKFRPPKSKCGEKDGEYWRLEYAGEVWERKKEGQEWSLKAI